MLIVKNKKAYFDYEIKDSWEAGIELKGYEIKSIRAKQVNLKGSYVSVSNGQLYVKKLHISVWKTLADKNSIETNRERGVFLHKKIIIFLSSKVKEKGYSIIPLELYFKGSLVKLRIGLAKGKKRYEKKQVLKEKTLKKEAEIKLLQSF